MKLIDWFSRTRAYALATRHLLIPIIFAVTFVPVHTFGAEKLELFTLGSGEVGGGYFAAANALCESVNQAHRGKLRCSPESTSGSLYNLAALRDRQLDFALVQSDWQNSAFKGTGSFAKVSPMKELRSVMSLYPETITVLARSDSGIEKLADILGKRVDIGHPASGRRATLDNLMAELGVGRKDFAELHELPSGSATGALCAGNIDATILVSGHPNEMIARALRECGAVIVAARGPKIDALLKKSKDYVSAVIPASAYNELGADVPSYAVMATLVTRSDIPNDFVEALVTDALNTLPELGRRSPVLASLSPQGLRTRGLTAPLHPGAEAAFKKFETP